MFPPAKALSAVAVLLATISLLAPVTSAESVWINCANDPAFTTSATRPTSLSCDSFCFGYDYAYYRTASHDCRCSNLPVPIQDMLGTTNDGGSCPDDRYSERKISSVYGSFLQCLSATNGMVNPQIFHGIPTVAACWDKCNTLPTGHTQYSSYKASNGLLECTCFNAFEGKPTGCGSGNTYVWQYGPNVVVSDTNRRRALREAARQQALLDSHPYCPVGMEACRVPGDPRAEASYECIYPGSELESCGGCLFGTMSNASLSTGVDCTALPGTANKGVSCHNGQCHATRCLTGYRLVDGGCVRN